MNHVTPEGLPLPEAAREFTAVEQVNHYLGRIMSLNEEGPRLHAVLETDPDAKATAASLDAERAVGAVRGPLHGIPVLLKDNIDTADRMHTSLGSTALLGSRPERDATVVSRLRAVGVIPLGKTNKTGMTSRSHGWSPRGGQCRNPYKLDRSPHGSSSGSAVAVAAGLAAAALGTDTTGSVLNPCSVNGIVGIRPTFGLISRAGVIPNVPSMETVGVLTRTVADVAALLGVLAGSDPLDEATAEADERGFSDYTAFLGDANLTGVRIGVLRHGYFGRSAHADTVAEEALVMLARTGAVIVDPVELPSFANTDAACRKAAFVLACRETKPGLERYLIATPGDHPRTLAELIAYNRAHADIELPYFPQTSLERLRDAEVPDEATYRQALATMHRAAREDGIDSVLAGHRLDALLTPGCRPAWKIDTVNGDPSGVSPVPLATPAGYPAISVPAGYAHGLPVGVTFTGAAWSEPVLIRIAHAFEVVHPVRHAPAFGPPEVGW